MMLVRPGLDRRDRGAQRRRLAAAGRADDEDHAVLVLEEVAELFHRGGGEAELLERRRPLARVEHAHDDLLAVHRAQARDAEVDVLAVLGLHAEAAVLRQALLGDVHPRHDLHAGDEPFVDPLGQVHHFLEDAVEAVADEHALLHRLDVHVARAAGDGAVDDEIDEVDDRRRIRALARRGGGRRRLLEDVDVAARHERGAGDGSPGRPRFLRRGRTPTAPADDAGVLRQRLVGIAVLDRRRGCRCAWRRPA